MDELSLTDFFTLDSLIRVGDKDTVIQFMETKNITKEIFQCLQFDCCSPLYTAAECGQLTIVTALIQRGLDFQHPLETLVLHIAAARGHLDVVKSLIEDHGYDIDQPDRSQETPLHKAVSEGRLDVVKYLVESGVNINAICSQGETLLHKGVEYPDICEYVLSHGFTNINAQDCHGNTVLYIAALFGITSLVRSLVDHGADVRVCNDRNMTPFWAAVCSGNLETMKYIYSHGADPEAENNGQPILAAAGSGHRDVVHFLAVVLNVSLGRKNRFDTPLGVALKKGSWDIAVLLLQSGSPVTDGDYCLLSESVGQCSDYRDIVRYFTDVLNKPRTLKDVCCFSIRNILGTGISSSADNLPLPSKLICYVKLTHVTAAR